MKRILLFIALLGLLPLTATARGTYQTPRDFLAEAFDGQVPEPRVLWLTGDRKTQVKKILGHPYPGLRVRYWLKGARSAWILEETGKDMPITFGVLVDDGRLARIRVLVFRESRGAEIRHPFFTEQFEGLRLDPRLMLDRSIDGISGATLSVRAMKKIAALALYLDTQVRAGHVTPSP